MIAMTRKHYIMIANTLGTQMRWEEGNSAARETIYISAHQLANAFKHDNPRFDIGRFLDHVLDVADGRRDLDGKKVAA